MSDIINILHLEDDAADAELIREKLLRGGITCRITRVQSREELETALRQGGYDLVLADYHVPSYDGISALRRLRELPSDLPFIFVSGTLGEEAAIEGLTQGATDYVLKQRLTRLVPAVKRAIGESVTRRESLRAKRDIALLSFALDNVHEQAFLVDENGWFQFVNGESCRTLGYSRAELLTMHVWDIAPEMSPERWVNHWTELKTKLSLILEETNRTKDGRSIPVEVSANYFEYAGKGYNLALIRDIRERKRAEEAQLRLNRELRAISNCNETLMRAVNENSLLDDICRIVCDEAGYEAAWVGYLENDRLESLRPIAWAEARGRERKDNNPGAAELAKSPACAALESGRSICIQDLGSTVPHELWEEEAAKQGYRSCIAFPLKDDTGHSYGVLTIFSSESNAFTPEETRLMEELAGDLAFGITTIRLRAERKAAESALLASEERFSAAFHLSPVAIAIIHLSDGRFVDANEVFFRSSGFARDEVIGHTTEELHLFDQQEDMAEMMAQLRERGLLQSFEHSARKKSGEIGIWLNSMALIKIGGEQHVLSLILDITERTKVEAKLRLLSHVVEQNPASVVVTRPDGSIEYVNPKFSLLTGYSLDEVLNKNPRIMKSGEMTPESYKVLWDTISSGGEWHGEFHNKKKNGELFWEAASISPVRSERGEITHYVAVKEDVTARKGAELAIRASLQEKETLLREIHHRVKNNLQVISSLLSLQANETTDARVTKAFAESQNRIRSMALVHEQLYRSQQFSAIDFRDYLTVVTSKLVELQAEQQIDSIVEVDNVWLDIDHAIPCGLIVNELVTNALKHAFPARTGGRVSVRMRHTDDRTVELIVEDNGSGFRPGVDFFSVKSMGSTIVRTLVDQLDGMLRLDREGGGTRFVIQFPAPQIVRPE